MRSSVGGSETPIKLEVLKIVAELCYCENANYLGGAMAPAVMRSTSLTHVEASVSINAV